MKIIDRVIDRVWLGLIVLFIISGLISMFGSVHTLNEVGLVLIVIIVVAIASYLIGWIIEKVIKI
jgi:ABC-type multidrug transport system permease subunit